MIVIVPIGCPAMKACVTAVRRRVPAERHAVDRGPVLLQRNVWSTVDDENIIVFIVETEAASGISTNSWPRDVTFGVHLRVFIGGHCKPISGD
ncbi:MAG: hypothetical protein HKL84_06190 [Acidimicrobiaceae bacterium]|nr:hypothetical protein [Acidimicrobiaceae bacterium]